MKHFESVYYSFPIQVFLVQLKNSPLTLLIWILLFAMITNQFGGVFGLHYLFLDPEYMGKVNIWSFLILGITVGAFFMTYFISCYILHSYRFPFLATLKYPFASFCINNFILPLAFLTTFVFLLADFQYKAEFAVTSTIIWNLLSLMFGITLIFSLASIYFMHTNKNVFALVGLKKLKGIPLRNLKKKALKWDRVQKTARIWRVDNFLTRKLKVRPVRGVEHYNENMLITVFKQHHYNSLLIQIVFVVLLISLGHLAEYDFFIIPAGASIFILFSILVMILGAFAYWTKGWHVVAVVGIIIVISILARLDVFNYQNQVFGMDYNSEYPVYSPEELAKFSSPERIMEDIGYTLEILENWKQKNVANGIEKPKMIFINASGGGHRGSVWTLNVLQELDRIFEGQVFNQTALISGASGGMLAAAYYRQLYLDKISGEQIDINDEKYIHKIGQDLLNPVSFMIVANDMFYPWRRYEVNGNVFRKDRAYMFEKYYNLNTNNRLNRPIYEYREPEYNGLIPMMILSPTIVSDERKLFVSPHPVSYLTRPYYDFSDLEYSIVDGVDFGGFFAGNNGYGISMTTALRLNATYPYVLPPAYLPSNPAIIAMDAGIRDNFGFETTIRFIHAFKDWINENTSGVIVISINSANASVLGKSVDTDGVFYTRLLNPITNIYANWIELQNFKHRHLLYYGKQWLNGDMHMVEFNYIPSEKEEIASMSFHLTTREKYDIIAAFQQEINQKALERLHKLMVPYRYQVKK